MKLETNNLVFDSNNPKCELIISAAQGEVYAFVKVLDCGKYHEHPKFYWGSYDHADPEGSILKIMERGGEWHNLANQLHKALND